jgi:predicted RNA-binding Zn-ribbon protein involved in translation (DUF1610 family)
MSKAFWIRVREQVQIAQVVVVVQGLGELGFLRDEALELDPSFVAESLVKGVDIDGCAEDEREDIRQVVQASVKTPTPTVKPKKAVEPVADEPPSPKCPECGETMVVRRGKYGDFYGCPNFIDGCRGKATIKA